MKRGDATETPSSRKVFKVERFIEKPNLEIAEKYLEEGGYFWNAGMFVWRPAVILSSIQKDAPELSTGLNKLLLAWEESGSIVEAMSEVYPNLKKISIDFAVMEKAKNVVMLESAFDWDDVGEWPAIARHYPADSEGNVFRGQGEAMEATGNLSYSEDGHTISLLGVKDLIVVQSGDATMVCHKDYAQQVKALAQKVCEKSPDLA